eukprot:EG_transcript_68324
MKFEEAPDRMHHVAHLLDLADGQYSTATFVLAERFILEYLQWEVNEVTPLCFLSHFTSHSQIGFPAVDRGVEVTAIELLDCALPDLRFGRYPLSFLTAAA